MAPCSPSAGAPPRCCTCRPAVPFILAARTPGRTARSTTARCVLRLIEATSGQVLFRGRDVLRLGRKDLRKLRADLQIVFQDPYASLNPRMQVWSIVAEPLIVHGMGTKEAKARAGELLELVRLRPEHASRYPHEFSSGQRQRIGVAAPSPSSQTCWCWTSRCPPST